MPKKQPEPRRSSSGTVIVEVLRSQSDPKYRALSIDDRRFGVDAGPWTVVDRFHVDRKSLLDHLQRKEKS